MKRFVTSRLGEEHRDALERMFYYHPEQLDFEEALVEHIRQYGSPQIVRNGSLLSISVPALPGAQTFYAVEQDETHLKLLGVMVIHRSGESILEMHHIAISPEVTHSHRREYQPIVALLIGELCKIGRRIRGIEKIKLAYRRGEIPVCLKLPVEHDPAPGVE